MEARKTAIIALATLSVAAMSGSAALAAAHRLNDAQMDRVTAGASSSASASQTLLNSDVPAQVRSSASAVSTGAAAPPGALSMQSTQPQTSSNIVTGSPAFTSAAITTSAPSNGAEIASSSRSSAFSSNGTASASVTEMTGFTTNGGGLPLQSNGLAGMLGAQLSGTGLMLPPIR